MKSRTSYVRAALSFVVTIAVATVFTLQSFAAPEATKPVVEATPQDGTAGTLTVQAGSVTINGNPAQTGATVLTGSVISSSSDGKAMVELGALGRVELGENTTVTLNGTAGVLGIKTACSTTEVEVRRGTLDVKSPKTETLTAGKKEHYDGGVDATSATGTDVKVQCQSKKKAGGFYIGPGLLGLLALIGLGAAVAIGIGVGDEGTPSAAAPSSPVR